MKSILLDLDGTLIDTEPAWAQSQRILAERFEITWTHADELSLVGHSLTYAAEVLERRGVGMAAEDIVNFRTEYVLSYLENEIPWKPGALDFLHAVDLLPITSALVTMSPRRMAEVIIQSLSLTQFQATVTGSDCLRGKPHPEPYLRALELLDVAPEQALVVEDSAPGAESAQSAGLEVLLVPSVLSVQPAPGRTPVGSLNDALKYIQGLMATS